MVRCLLILLGIAQAQTGDFEECYKGIECSENLNFVIPNEDCSASKFQNLIQSWFEDPDGEIENSGKIFFKVVKNIKKVFHIFSW